MQSKTRHAFFTKSQLSQTSRTCFGELSRLTYFPAQFCKDQSFALQSPTLMFWRMPIGARATHSALVPQDATTEQTAGAV